MERLGIMLLVFAAVLALVGVMLLVGGRLGLGSLPGDLRFEGEGYSCVVPIASSIIISLLLTLVLNVIARLLK
jgi:hypothetical protein